MSYFLLQSPKSPLAGEFDSLVNWQGIYYHPEQHASPRQTQQPSVVVWDCHSFAQDYQNKWAERLPPHCLVIALISDDYNRARLDACKHLHAALPATMDPPVLRHNLHLAEKVLKRHAHLNEQLRLAELKIEQTGIIGQAKKWLIEHWSLSEEQAHRWLQRQSQVKQQKIINTARQVMQGYYSGINAHNHKNGE